MHPIRKQRLQIVLLIILAAACASGLVIYMLGQNTNYFYTPSQIQSGEAPQGVFVRAGGMVVDGSIERDLDSLDVAFKVTDGGAAVLVKYSGILPDLFAEGQGMVGTGRLVNGVFEASEILARHDETYMPKAVADELKKTGHWKDDYDKKPSAQNVQGNAK